MIKIIASIILILIIINISQAVDSTATELNKIYILYGKEDYQTAERDLLSLTINNNPKQQFIYTLELGDFYLDKFNNYTKAESIYKLLTEKFPKHQNIADIYYRLGVTYEKEERYLEAAQMYEMVATKYRKSQYAQDGLDAIERCFKKNYQDLVAKVDGYPLTRIEFDDRIAQNPGAYEKFDAKKQLLDEMINDRIMYQEALNRRLNQTDDFKTRFSEIKSNTMFQNWYQKEVINSIKISEGEKKSYYKKQRDEFIIPEQVSAREILVKTKTEADSLYRLITIYKLPFDSVAQEISLAPTKSAGGDLGYFRRGTQPKELEDVVFKLKPNIISQPFYSETKVGYLLLQVEDYKPKKVRTYSEAANEIENRLRGQKTDETFKTKSDAFKKASTIIIDELAIKENRDTVAMIDSEPMTQATINDYISRIPPFYRSEFESPEGKKRILDQLILEKTWLKQLEKEKYWLLNVVFSQLDDTKKGLLISNIRKIEVNDKTVVSESELQNEYKKTLNEYKMPKQVRAREITVVSESLARVLRNKVLSGEITFDSLAREYSTAPSKGMGGDMGFFSTGSKPKEIEQVAFKSSKGQISKIIKLNDSTYTIIKVEEVKEASTKPFDDVKTTLQRRLQQNKDQEIYTNFIAELRKPHQIEIYLVDEIPNEEPGQQEMPKTEQPKKD